MGESNNSGDPNHFPVISVGTPEDSEKKVDEGDEFTWKIRDIMDITKTSQVLLDIINGTTDAIFTKDLNWKYTFVNKVVAEIIGKPIDEIIGKDDTELFSELSAISIINQDHAVLECRKTNTSEVVIQTADWEKKIFLATNGPLCDFNGNQIGLFGISRDITNRKKSEIELKWVNRTLKMITECNKILLHSETEQDLLDSICSVIIKNGWYYMTWIGYIWANWEKVVNPVASAGFEDGYLDIFNISWDENKETGCGPTWKAIRENRSVYIKDAFTDPSFIPWKEDAIKKWYRSTISIPLSVNNNIIGALSIYSSEIGLFNDEEVKLLEDLSINISRCICSIRNKEENKKTSKLLKESEEQLQIRQRMDSLGTLAGGIGHDFNNLLTWIMGYLDLLNRDSNLSDIHKEYVKNSLLSSRRAADLIKQLQNLSKNAISEKTSIDIYNIASEVFWLLDKTTDKIINFKEGEFYILWNASELHQVLLNLGTNSYKAIEERGIEEKDYIKIDVCNYKSSNNDRTGLPEWDYIHIYFEDNGKWMSNEVLKKAFDPLFTTRTKSWQRGQGLGLAMVYNIITKRHNWHIHIDSKDGVWTTIHIYLPKAMPVEKKTQNEIVDESGGKKTILVLEDEKMIQDFVKTVLEMNGYNVIIADDGKAGLDTYITNINIIDLVILDLTMPKMSWQEVLKKMLEIKNNVKVIISSGQNSEDIREWILSKAKGYVNKPYRINTLTWVVRTVLNNKD